MWCVFRIVFAPRSVIRVTILSLIIAAAIIAWVQVAIPGVQLPIWKMLLSVPIMYAYMAVMLLLHLVVPTSVKVRKDRIHTTTGKSNWVLKAKDVYRARIVVFAVDRIRLRIFYTRKNRRRSRTFGVSPKINLDALCANLPIYPQVWDARNRYRNTKCAIAAGLPATRS